MRRIFSSTNIIKLKQKEKEIQAIIPEIKKLVCLAQGLFETGHDLGNFLSNGYSSRLSFQRCCHADEPMRIKAIGFGNFWSKRPELWIGKDGPCYGKKSVHNYDKFLKKFIKFKRDFLSKYKQEIMDSGQISKDHLEAYCIVL